MFLWTASFSDGMSSNLYNSIISHNLLTLILILMCMSFFCFVEHKRRYFEERWWPKSWRYSTVFLSCYSMKVNGYRQLLGYQHIFFNFWLNYPFNVNSLIYIYCWCVYSECLLHSQALEEEKVVYDRSSSKNIYLNVAVNTLKKLRSKSTPTSPVISASNTNTQINTPVIMSFPLCIYLLISRCSSEVTEVY